MDSKEIRIEYCPTGEMVADFFTKPLQGALFEKLRNKIMNIEDFGDITQRRGVLGMKSEPVGRISPSSETIKSLSTTCVPFEAPSVSEPRLV